MPCIFTNALATYIDLGYTYLIIARTMQIPSAQTDKCSSWYPSQWDYPRARL